MRDLILDEYGTSQSDAVDGGAAGSGLPEDPTQGSGTPAWQAAQKMAMIVNARKRRN